MISAIVFYTMALLFLSCCSNNNVSQNVANKRLILYNFETGEKIEEFPIKVDDTFSVSFMHSVNKSPVIDYYKFDPNNNSLYVFKTIYYGFGAGVQTELNDGETIKYGDDGSMIIEHIDKKIDELTYYLSDISDHNLRINDGDPISLWDICGKKKIIIIKVKNK